MAEYAANVLKNEALYYRLSRATLRDGILHLSAGGYAETEVTSLQLTNLTEYFRVSYIADRYCDSYDSNIRIFVWAKDKDGNNYNYTFFPCDTHNNLFLQEFQVKATAYEKLTWRIESDVTLNVSLWELCPEAEDINVQTIIDGVNQSLPRLLFDYNTWPLTVDLGETTVGLITFRLLDKTDLQGHFIMSFYASEAAILTVRFYTNEIEELFAPLTYDIRKGYNSIGIPHCYLHRSAGMYSVMATAQVSAGVVTVPTRGVLYSIDGGYLAKRELDVAMDVQDLAIRQLAESYGPDEIWLVGIDAGEGLVRKRDYNETNPNVAWTPVGSLGQIIAAAIEFNGVWHIRPDADQYTIETEEVPWLFWVDSFGILYGCKGIPNEERTNVIELAREVTANVKAVRGYSSIEYIQQDQGLIVAYIRTDGMAYYRTYSYNETSHSVIWEQEQALPVPANKYNFIAVHRLNDYRVGFELSGEDNLWLITDRTFVGQSAYPERSYVSPVYAAEDYTPLIGYYPNGYTPPTVEVYDLTVEECFDGEHPYWLYSFWIDHEIFANNTAYPVLSRFAVSGLNDAQYLADVEWECLNGQTHITIRCNQGDERREVSTRRYFNIKGHSALRIRDNEDPNYVAVQATDIQVLFDFTEYILHEEREQFSIRPSGVTLTYNSIGHPKGYGDEVYNSLRAIGSTVDYKQMQYMTETEEETMAGPTGISSVVSYYKSGSEPV